MGGQKIRQISSRSALGKSMNRNGSCGLDGAERRWSAMVGLALWRDRQLYVKVCFGLVKPFEELRQFGGHSRGLVRQTPMPEQEHAVTRARNGEHEHSSSKMHIGRNNMDVTPIQSRGTQGINGVVPYGPHALTGEHCWSMGYPTTCSGLHPPRVAMAAHCLHEILEQPSMAGRAQQSPQE